VSPIVTCSSALSHARTSSRAAIAPPGSTMVCKEFHPLLRSNVLNLTHRSWRNNCGPFTAFGCCLRNIVTQSNLKRMSLTSLSQPSSMRITSMLFTFQGSGKAPYHTSGHVRSRTFGNSATQDCWPDTTEKSRSIPSKSDMRVLRPSEIVEGIRPK